MRRQFRFIVGLTALLFSSRLVLGQDHAAAASGREGGPAVVATVSDVTRAESWSFFEPRAGGGNPTYGLLGNRATLAVAMWSRHLDLHGAFQYSQLLGLPSRSSGPGPLGPGPTYFESARATRAYQLYIRAASLRVKSAAGISLEAGRMDVTSGMESPSSSPALERLKGDRLAGRLIGGADWTPFQRAFDGVHLAIDRTRWRASSSLLFPTQGAFEESANPTMSALRIVTGSVTLGGDAHAVRSAGAQDQTASEFQVFVTHYRDRRAVRARPDNSALGALNVDVDVGTVGASHVSVVPWRGGRIDTIVWVAGQFGDWYGSDHTAFSVIAEGGYELPLPWRPHLRGGLMHASGDDDPRDLRHGTFFPMLPTTGPDLLGGTFAQMNLRQFFGEVRLVPSARLVLSASLNRLSLVRAEDRWYSGTGATAIRGTYFGFSGRTSAFSTGLGTLASTAAEARITARWAINAELGMMRGGDVVRGQFSGTRLAVFALENRIAF